MEDFDFQDRLFFVATIWMIREHIQLNNKHPNVFSRARLFSGLKDICLLIESLLRKKQISSGVILPGTQIMLGKGNPGLLENALRNHSIGYPQTAPTLKTGANDLQEFLNNLENILLNAVSPELRRIYCLHLVRNFTGHHFDVSSTVTSTGGIDLFNSYEVVFVNILSSLMYFKYIGEIQ